MESVVSSEEKWRVVRKWLEKGEIDMNPADLYISAFRNGVRVNQTARLPNAKEDEGQFIYLPLA